MTGGGRSEEEILESITEAIAKNRVVLFMKGTPAQPQCGFSATAADIVRSLNVPFEGVNAVAEPAFRSVLSKYSSWPTLPQLFVGGKLVGGTDILKEMQASGELQKVVAEAVATPTPAPAPAA
ncbi:MAG: Grx4 family monothiol glutaredoxin [Acidobacteriota bacterium]